MLEKIKSRFTNAKKKKIGKKEITVLVTVMISLFTISNLMDYNPAFLRSPQQSENKSKRNSDASYTQSLGDKQILKTEGKSGSNKKLPESVRKPVQRPQIPENNFFKNLPMTLPDFNTKPNETQKNPTTSTPEINSNVYARHANLTSKAKDFLNEKFNLDKFSSEPQSISDSRFNSSYSFKDGEDELERFDLMSIVKTKEMNQIVTATDALNALIEESDAVNILETTDKYVIFDIAGSKGYQIGKIEIDEDGIYILGYINLTTNSMPTVLKNAWKTKLVNLI